MACFHGENMQQTCRNAKIEGAMDAKREDTSRPHLQAVPQQTPVEKNTKLQFILSALLFLLILRELQKTNILTILIMWEKRGNARASFRPTFCPFLSGGLSLEALALLLLCICVYARTPSLEPRQYQKLLSPAQAALLPDDWNAGGGKFFLLTLFGCICLIDIHQIARRNRR